MTHVCVLLLIVSSLQPFDVAEREDRWLAQDKLLHISLSSALVSTLYHLHRYRYGDSANSSQVFAAQVSISLGIVKEMSDAQFSYRDLIADLVGIAVGLILFVR